jgi:hypothetical protein
MEDEEVTYPRLSNHEKRTRRGIRVVKKLGLSLKVAFLFVCVRVSLLVYSILPTGCAVLLGPGVGGG